MHTNGRMHLLLPCLALVSLLAGACGPAATPIPATAPPATSSSSVEQPVELAVAAKSAAATVTPLPPSATPLPSATLVPATATPLPPTATALPPASPTPAPGDLLFGMADDDCDWSPFAWVMETGDDTDNYTFEADPEQLYIEVPQADTVVYAECWRNPRLRDVQIDVDVANIAGPNSNNISVVCRMNDRGWYEASIHSGGYWYIYHYSDSDGYEVLDMGASTAIDLQHARNHLTMVCAGDTISFSVNAVALGSVTDLRQRTGHVAISVTTFELKGAGITFELLRVTIPDPANLPSD